MSPQVAVACLVVDHEVAEGIPAEGPALMQEGAQLVAVM